ncbi:hypothetical protein T07_2539 [Trichinella nelsoni]|uniref:Uncharacterized protein n=1 Tax=Trichinella nelsoni TaxID=6336 RepID=A0A0V0SF40_9BILA|nr:hypothetical protein T07_2539 [Trichinella nelsoni]
MWKQWQTNLILFLITYTGNHFWSNAHTIFHIMYTWITFELNCNGFVGFSNGALVDHDARESKCFSIVHQRSRAANIRLLKRRQHRWF